MVDTNLFRIGSSTLWMKGDCRSLLWEVGNETKKSREANRKGQKWNVKTQIGEENTEKTQKRQDWTERKAERQQGRGSQRDKISTVDGSYPTLVRAQAQRLHLVV